MKLSSSFFCVSAVVSFFVGTVVTSGKEPSSYRQAAALSVAERQTLTRKAELGDVEAASALALYYATGDRNPKKRERFLTLASRNGSRETVEALADFYSMPGGMFQLQKAISLRKDLKRKFPTQVDNIEWAEGCAFEYHYLATNDARKKELIFLRLAESWGSMKAKQALKGISIDRFPVPTASR
jgi:hypothetical protein